MDENLWKMIQIYMAITGIQTTLIIAVIGFMWRYFSSEIISIKSDSKDEFKGIREDLKDIRTSLNRMEGAFYNRDCCILKDDKHQKKVE